MQCKQKISFILLLLFHAATLHATNPTQFLIQFSHQAIPRLFEYEINLNHPSSFKLTAIAPDWYIYELAVEPRVSNQFLDSINALPYIQKAQINHANIELRSTPNDDDFLAQWYLNNTGISPGGGNADINALDAWNHTSGGTTALGEPIAIAVIDGGFFLNHEDLTFAVNQHEIPNNNIDDDQNGFIDDYLGWNAFLHNDSIYNSSHGTHVAGIIGAKGNNSKGVSGVNWNVELIPICGATSTESVVVEAYYYAYQLKKQYVNSGGTKGRNIVATNGSFGVSMAQPTDYPIWCAIYDSLLTLGILNVVAAPNNNVNVDLVGDIPCSCNSESIIAVTASNSFDAKLPTAGFGKKSIDIAAPGEQIHSTIPFNDYGTKNGTSMATPMVAGAIGLMYAAACENLALNYKTKPQATALFIKSKLIQFGVDPSESLSELLFSGGRLNLGSAVESMLEDNCAQLQFTVDSITCFEACNGAITLEPFGLKEPITYQWNNNLPNVQTAYNLCQNKYEITATDANGKKVSTQVYLTQPDSIGYELLIYPETDLLNNGAVEIIPTEANELVESTFGSTQNQMANYFLTAGNYPYTLTNSDSCTIQRLATVPFDGVEPKNAAFFKAVNPTEGALYLELLYTPQVLGNFDFMLISSNGQVVENWGNVPLNAEKAIRLNLKSKLSNGLYFIYLKQENRKIDSYKFLYVKP